MFGVPEIPSGAVLFRVKAKDGSVVLVALAPDATEPLSSPILAIEIGDYNLTLNSGQISELRNLLHGLDRLKETAEGFQRMVDAIAAGGSTIEL